MNQPNVFMLGDWEQAEFRPAVEFLRRNANLYLHESDIWGSLTHLDLIFFVVARTGRFSEAEVEALHRRAPLARLVALLGSWCEGEVRSGHPWPGVTRIYAHQWQARLTHELKSWQPRTANEIDRLMNTSLPSKPIRKLIGIAAAQSTMFDALAAACRSLGIDAVWLLPNLPSPVQRVDAIIYDSTLDLSAELARLKELRQQLHSPPAIMLLDFPRQVDMQQATEAGATSLLAKPFLLTDLAAEIERVTTAPAVRLVAAA